MVYNIVSGLIPYSTKLLEITVDCDVTCQLLIMYSGTSDTGVNTAEQGRVVQLLAAIKTVIRLGEMCFIKFSLNLVYPAYNVCRPERNAEYLSRILYPERSERRRCFVTIALRSSSGIRHWEYAGKPTRSETEWDKQALSLC